MPDVDTIHRYYELVDEGAVDALVDLFSDDIVYRRPGHPPIEGIEAFRAFYEEGRPIGASNHSIEATYIDGETVIVRGRFSGTLAGDEVAFVFVDIHHFDAEGSIDKRWTYTDIGTV